MLKWPQRCQTSIPQESWVPVLGCILCKSASLRFPGSNIVALQFIFKSKIWKHNTEIYYKLKYMTLAHPRPRNTRTSLLSFYLPLIKNGAFSPQLNSSSCSIFLTLVVGRGERKREVTRGRYGAAKLLQSQDFKVIFYEAFSVSHSKKN